jgi:peptidoglycan hydrolase-like protein with peptidoglycan-binding domain
VQRHPVLSAGLILLALTATSCKSASDPASSVALAPSPAPTATAAGAEPTLTPVVPVATLVPTRAPSPTAAPKPALPTYDVKAVQRQLTDQHYFAGAIDGTRGSQLRSAVMAFQKVNGLGVDGSIGPATLAALKAPRVPVLRGSGGGTRVEVDLTRQVLYVVKGGVIARILPVSSGNGKTYLTKSGSTATALSPVGKYVIQRRIIGERHAELGTLYDPQYFYRGWAIHGSNSVPAYPASHGCTRVTRPDAKYLLGVLSVGTPVYFYGGAFTFTAGSSAPGTSDPGGDTPDSSTPSRPTPTSTPTQASSPSATPAPSPTASPSASPTPLIP